MAAFRNKIAAIEHIPAKYRKASNTTEDSTGPQEIPKFDNAFTLTFRDISSKGLCGCNGSDTYPLSDVLPNGIPQIGETWECFLDNNSKMLGTRCVPFKFIGCSLVEKTSPVTEYPTTVGENTASGTGEIRVTTPRELNTCETMIVKQTTMAPNDDVLQIVREKETLSREYEKLKEECAGLRTELAESKKNNQSLRQQIRSLNFVGRTANIEQLKSQIETKDSEINSLKFEIERYRSFIETNNIDMTNVNPDRGKIFQTMMTSPSRIHSTAFGDGLYTIQVGKGFTELRFIPDIHGNVTACNGDIELFGLGRFVKFEILKKLNTCIQDGVITVCN